jgi:ribosomal protein S12 methylthiotransferase accessory factor
LTARADASHAAPAQARHGPSTKRYRQGTHRTIDPRTTVARTAPHAEALGVTRVADVTGLDRVGIPVVMMVRPASRNLSVTQGKGVSLDTALASGWGEAVESFCSERIMRIDRMATLRRARDDRAFVLPSHFIRKKPPPDLPIPWSECDDLFGDKSRLAPAELIYADFSAPPPKGQGFFDVSTNGLAAGNSRDEALLHGLCELIERDALALFMVRQNRGRAAPPLDPKSFFNADVTRLLALLDAAGLVVDIFDISSDLNVPAYVATIDDRRAGEAFCIGRIVGSGCHPSATIALSRAITEAAQARLTIIAGARDDLDMELYSVMGLNALFPRSASSARKFLTRFEDRSFATEDVAEDLRLTLERLSAAGIEKILAADLPCPIESFACVRVLAPELESLYEKPWYRPAKRAQALAKALS